MILSFPSQSRGSFWGHRSSSIGRRQQSSYLDAQYHSANILPAHPDIPRIVAMVVLISADTFRRGVLGVATATCHGTLTNVASDTIVRFLLLLKAFDEEERQ